MASGLSHNDVNWLNLMEKHGFPGTHSIFYEC